MTAAGSVTVVLDTAEARLRALVLGATAARGGASELLTDEEIAAHQMRLSEVGRRRWMAELLLREPPMAVDRLIALVLGVPQAELAGLALPDRLLVHFHRVAVSYLRVRSKLAHVNTLDDVLDLLRRSRRIMVLTGAGVSVSCGIPDFRSRNGIYRRLRDEYRMEQPEDMFDIVYFLDKPEPFFSFAKELFPGNFRPSPSHYFIRLLEERGQLLRNYTQNIDTLENVAGVTRVFQCHGSFSTATCMRCQHKVDGEAIRADVMAQRVPYCPLCTAREQQVREAYVRRKRKAGDEDGEDDEDDDAERKPPYVLKPDIVFFGQKLSDDFERLLMEDRDQVDLLVVIGSSLKVEPVAGIMGYLSPDVPQVLINREPIRHMQFDVELLGDCDVVIGELCRRLGWQDKLERLIGSPLQPARQPCEARVLPPPADTAWSGKEATASSEAEEEPFTFVPPNRYLFEGAVLGNDDESEQEDEDGKESEESDGDVHGPEEHVDE